MLRPGTVRAAGADPRARASTGAGCPRRAPGERAAGARYAGDGSHAGHQGPRPAVMPAAATRQSRRQARGARPAGRRSGHRAGHARRQHATGRGRGAAVRRPGSPTTSPDPCPVPTRRPRRAAQRHRRGRRPTPGAPRPSGSTAHGDPAPARPAPSWTAHRRPGRCPRHRRASRTGRARRPPAVPRWNGVSPSPTHALTSSSIRSRVSITTPLGHPRTHGGHLGWCDTGGTLQSDPRPPRGLLAENKITLGSSHLERVAPDRQSGPSRTNPPRAPPAVAGLAGAGSGSAGAARRALRWHDGLARHDPDNARGCPCSVREAVVFVASSCRYALMVRALRQRAPWRVIRQGTPGGPEVAMPTSRWVRAVTTVGVVMALVGDGYGGRRRRWDRPPVQTRQRRSSRPTGRGSRR